MSCGVTPKRGRAVMPRSGAGMRGLVQQRQMCGMRADTAPAVRTDLRGPLPDVRTPRRGEEVEWRAAVRADGRIGCWYGRRRGCCAAHVRRASPHTCLSIRARTLLLTSGTPTFVRADFYARSFACCPHVLQHKALGQRHRACRRPSVSSKKPRIPPGIKPPGFQPLAGGRPGLPPLSPPQRVGAYGAGGAPHTSPPEYTPDRFHVEFRRCSLVHPLLME